MLEHKHKGVLSLNLKKLASRFDDSKIILILQSEMSLLMLLCKRVIKQRKHIPRYGKNTHNSFLGTVCSNIFCQNCLFKYFFISLSTKLFGKEFFFKTCFR